MGPALAKGDDVADLHVEGRGAVSRDVGVALLETVVFLHVVKVVTTDDNGADHLVGLDDTLHDVTTDADITGEGALVVDVLTLNGGTRGLETKADVAVIAAFATTLRKKKRRMNK